MSVIFENYYPSLETMIKENEMYICSYSSLKKSFNFIYFTLDKKIIEEYNKNLLIFSKEEVKFTERKLKTMINDKYVALFNYSDFITFRDFLQENLTEEEYLNLKENYMFNIVPIG